MASSGRPRKVDPRVDNLSSLIERGYSEDIKQVLSELGIDAQDGYERTALLWSVVHQNEELLMWLIAHQANLNHQDRIGYTALHFAAQDRREAAARLLLEHGANPNVTDKHGNTSLWTAVFNARGNWEFVKLLLAKGADPDIINYYQSTPRILAAKIANTELADLES